MLKKINFIFFLILVFSVISFSEANSFSFKQKNFLLAQEEQANQIESQGANRALSEASNVFDSTLDNIENTVDNKINLYNDNIQTTKSVNSNIKNTSNVKDNVVGKIVNVEAVTHNGNTILTFSVTKDFSTNVKVINFPFRVIFDAPMPYEWDVPEENMEDPVLNKVVSSIRYGNPDDSTLRILTSLKYPVNINRAFFLPDKDEYKFIIDFRQADILTNLLNSSTIVVPHTKEYYAVLEKNIIAEKKKEVDLKRELAINKWIEGYLKNVSYPTPTIQTDENYNGNKVVVVIDPGHGGKDPGAINGTDPTIKEKDIVLSISNLITSKLIKYPEIAVVLTRTGDYFVPLKDRVLWAKKFNADLFISIHADRAPSPDSEGLSVYTLSQNASDAQTQVIATNENKSDIIAGLSDDEDTEVSRILINLLQRLKINDSVTLAQSVLSSASECISLLPNPLRSAGFVVLQVPETPSILIETGFLSNDRDAKNLISAEYQNLIAEKITKGIENYLLSKGKIKL